MLANDAPHPSLKNAKYAFDPLTIHTKNRAELLVLNSNFQTYVANIRHSFNVPEEYIPILSRRKKALWLKENKVPRLQEWNSDISILMKKCNLLSGWRIPLEGYILSNTFIAPLSLEVTNDIDKFGNNELKIVVNDYTNMKELQFAHSLLRLWRTVLDYQREGQIAQPIRNLDIYRRMLELEKENKSDQKIADIINKENTDSAFTAKEVHDAIVRIKKQIKAQMS